MLSCKNVVSCIFARVNEFQIDKTTGHAEYPQSDTRATMLFQYVCNSRCYPVILIATLITRYIFYIALLRARTVH